MKLLRYAFLLLLFCFYNLAPTLASCLGCVELDHITFNMLISRFPHALVKFDIAFPYGDKHEAFCKFSIKAHSVTGDLLIGHVGIKDYGEKENSDLAAKYNVKSDKYPTILLFRNNSVNDFVKFPFDTDVTIESLKEFVTHNTNLFFGLDGCVKEFDNFVINYPKKNPDEQQILIEKSYEILGNVQGDKKKASAKIYIAFMKLIREKGTEFVKAEAARLTKLKSSKVTETKKLELTRRLNILLAFQNNSSRLKNEL